MPRYFHVDLNGPHLWWDEQFCALLELKHGAAVAEQHRIQRERAAEIFRQAHEAHLCGRVSLPSSSTRPRFFGSRAGSGVSHRRWMSSWCLEHSCPIRQAEHRR